MRVGAVVCAALLAAGSAAADPYVFQRIVDDTGPLAPFSAAQGGVAISPDGHVGYVALTDSGSIELHVHLGALDRLVVTAPTAIVTNMTNPPTLHLEASFLGFDAGGPRIFRGLVDVSSLYGPSVATTESLPDANGSGLLAFKGTTAGQGVGIYKGQGGSPLAVALVGSDGISSLENAPAINDAEQVAYEATVAGVDVIHRRLALASVPTVISDTSGDILRYIGDVDIAQDGRVAFRAGLDAGPQVIRSGNGGALTTHADTRGAYSLLADVAIRSGGEVVFWASLADGGGEGLFTGDNPDYDAIIRTGDFLDGSQVVEIYFNRQGLADDGRVAFAARLADGRTGVYRGTPGVLLFEALEESDADAMAAASTTVPRFHFEAGDFRSFSGKIAVSAFSPPGAEAKVFVRKYRNLLRWTSPDQELEPTSVEDYGDEAIVRFQQRYKGHRVFGASLAVSIEPGDFFQPAYVRSVLGALSPDLFDLDVVPAIDAATAVTVARAAFGDPAAVPYFEPDLFVYDGRLVSPGPSSSPGVHLVYRVHLAGSPGAHGFLVDANSAALVATYGLQRDDHAGFDLLVEQSFGGSMVDDDCFRPGLAYPDLATENGLEPLGQGDNDAAALWLMSHVVFDVLLNQLGRCGHDGICGHIEIHAHARAGDANASYNPGCDEFEFSTGWPSLDVMAHEMSHGIVSHTSELVYMNESGALDESYADTIGYVVDPKDSLHAEDRIGGFGPTRDLDDPPSFGQPDRYRDLVITTDDFGGVHSNSGILNKAHYLMANGGRHNGIPAPAFPPIQGIGVSKLGKLVYDVMRALPSGATFATAAAATIDRALLFREKGLWGFTDQDVCDVRNALRSVEISFASDQNCDGVPDDSQDGDGDGVPDARDNCPVDKNYSQADCDQNGVGDACETLDWDEDVYPNGCDNCIEVANDQRDSDGDGVGDACDADLDGDGVSDDADNCPYDANADQQDSDGEGHGDVCDPDQDGDGIGIASDNCPFVANASQTDTDGDGKGDACDGCPAASDPAQAYTSGIPELGVLPAPIEPDQDGDGIPDACDPFDWGTASLVLGATNYTPTIPVYAVNGSPSSLQVVSGSGSEVIRIPVDVCVPTAGATTLREDTRLELVAEGFDTAYSAALMTADGTRREELSEPRGVFASQRGLWVRPDCERDWVLEIRPGGAAGAESFSLKATLVTGTGGSSNPWTSRIGGVTPPAPLADADFDGLWDGIDTCPLASDPSNADTGQLGGAGSDGSGDVCQCGDGDGDGDADLVDVVVSSRDAAGMGPGAEVDKCTLAPPPGAMCRTDDVLALRTALTTRIPLAQTCPATL